MSIANSVLCIYLLAMLLKSSMSRYVVWSRWATKKVMIISRKKKPSTIKTTAIMLFSVDT